MTASPSGNCSGSEVDVSEPVTVVGGGGGSRVGGAGIVGVGGSAVGEVGEGSGVASPVAFGAFVERGRGVATSVATEVDVDDVTDSTTDARVGSVVAETGEPSSSPPQPAIASPNRMSAATSSVRIGRYGNGWLPSLDRRQTHRSTDQT